MEYISECWNGCGEEFVVHAPDRSDPRLVEGVQTRCDECGHPYIFTVDGDGEPELQDAEDTESLGQNISGRGSEDSTHY